jgi:hypothetical protein
MTQIHELRTRNKVKCKVSNDAGIYDIVHINGMMLTVMLSGARDGIWYTADKLKGIKLTPEILEKAGLKFEVYGHDGERDVASCFLGNGISILDTMAVLVNHEEIKGIKYLHQLQNLYFALTEKELTINL